MPRAARSILSVIGAGGLLLGLAPGRSRACDMNVREAGFLTQSGHPYDPRPYALWCVTRTSTPEARTRVAQLGKFCRAQGINLQSVLIPVGRQPASMRRSLEQRGVDLDELPVSVILQFAGDLGTLHLQRGMVDEALIRSMAATAAKEEMKKLLVDNANYCVLLFVPGRDEEASAAALGEVRAAIREHGRRKPEQKMPVLRVGREDPREAFLLSELGLDAGRPADAAPAADKGAHRFDLLWLAPVLLAAALAAALACLRGRPRLRAGVLAAGGVVLLGLGLLLALRPPPAGGRAPEPAAAIVFGKGRLLLPVFRGAGLRRDALLERFAFLNHNASDCGADPVFVNDETRDLLLRWEPELDRRVIRQILDSGAVPELEQKLAAWWKEVSFNASGDPTESEPAPPGPPSTEPPPARSGAWKLWAGPILAVAGALVLVLAAGWLRIRKRRAA